MKIIENILPISLLIIGLYSLLYVYLKELNTFEIVEGFKEYNERIHSTRDNLLLSDTFTVKDNIGIGNNNYLSSNDLFNNDKNKKNKIERNNNKNIHMTPDNNNCIPFELCNSFYGNNYQTI